ncbi:outer membrane beta-barrel protein [Thalassotalea nanhaiensis]|uniref:Outer membrane beta-barrel protein n=1 Tax=Thalassotalea nanhaiensis TaxID=3065648 RepID=A0ABY9TFW1_9GAMM|nr:outer membrane beta-barrel protein [Colwelliaceae bacterium SQ345]
MLKKLLKKPFLAPIAALSMLTLSAPSFANIYIGAGAYKSETEGVPSNDDEEATAVFLGYNFVDSNVFMFSVEGGYYDLGSFSGSANGDDYESEAEAYTLAGVAYLPIGPFIELYGKVGMAMVEGETVINGEKYSDDGEEAFGGVGMSIDILDTVDIYAEYLVFDNEIESEMAGVGVRLAF